MSLQRHISERGNATIEFALTFMPLTLLMLGIVEVARIGWMHQTLTMSVKSVARQAVVHGEKCVELTPSCAKTIGHWVNSAQSKAIGLDGGKMNLTFSGNSSTKSCQPATACLSDGTVWPPSSENAVGLPVMIRGTYEMTPFYWLIGDRPNGSWTLTVSSREVIQF